MHAGNSAEGPLTPGLVFEMMQAHQRTAALKAAIDLDVFRELSVDMRQSEAVDRGDGVMPGGDGFSG